MATRFLFFSSRLCPLFPDTRQDLFSPTTSQTRLRPQTPRVRLAPPRQEPHPHRCLWHPPPSTTHRRSNNYFNICSSREDSDFFNSWRGRRTPFISFKPYKSIPFLYLVPILFTDWSPLLTGRLTLWCVKFLSKTYWKICKSSSNPFIPFFFPVSPLFPQKLAHQDRRLIS